MVHYAFFLAYLFIHSIPMRMSEAVAESLCFFVEIIISKQEVSLKLKNKSWSTGYTYNHEYMYNLEQDTLTPYQFLCMNLLSVILDKENVCQWLNSEIPYLPTWTWHGIRSPKAHKCTCTKNPHTKIHTLMHGLVVSVVLWSEHQGQYV